MANNNKKFAVKNGLLTQNIDFLSPDESNVIAVTMSNADVLNVDGTLSATTFSGSGASLTSLNASNISSGTLAQARLANSSFTINGTSISLGGTATITSNAAQALTLGSYLTGTSYNGGTAVTAAVDATSANTASKVVARDASGNFSAGTITATLSGTATSATTAGTVTTAAQPNITSVGTLSSLSVTGNTTSGNFITTGNANVGTLYSSGKIIGTNTSDLILNSGVGLTEGAQITLAWKTVTGLTGQGNGSWNLDSDGSNNFRILYQNTTGGTGVPITVYSGNNDVSFAANVIGTHYGAATGLTSIPGANVTGTVANATYATSAGTVATVTSAAQPNITSHGTLVNLFVNATVNAVGYSSNVATGTAPFTVISTTRVANLNVATAGVADSAGSATTAGTVTTNAQPNITSVGTLSSLSVTGDTTANRFISLNNGNAMNFKVGDDAWLGDVNNADTVGIIGQQNAVNGYLVFGNADNSSRLGRSGTGPLTYAGAFSATGNVITAAQLVSTVAVGTAPAVVTSTTRVSNLNVAQAGVSDTSTIALASTGNYYPTFVSATSGNLAEVANATYIANLANGSFTATTFVGALSGTASSATTAATATKVQAAVTGTNTAELVRGNMADNDQFRILVGGTATNTGYVELATADDGTEPIYVRQYTGVFTTIARTATLLDAAGNTQFPGEVTSTRYISNIATGTAPLTVTSTTRVANLNVATAGVADSATTAGTVTTAAQPNITSHGTLVNLYVNAAVNATSFTSNVATGTAPLSVVSTTQVGNLYVARAGIADTSTVALATTGTYYPTFVSATSGNLSEVANASFSANIANGYLTATGFVGNGSALSAITGANVTGTVANATYAVSAGTAGTVTTNAQPNITSVGTLSSLTVTANTTSGNISTGGELTVSGNAVITGNLTVNGSTIYSNVTTMNIKDPIIELGGTGNASNLTSNDGKDRGEILHVFEVAANAQVDKFMGWDTSNAEFAFGSNVTTSSEVVTFNTLGNVRAGTFIGTHYGAATGLTSIPGANVTGTVANATYAVSSGRAGTVTTAAQPNITSHGTLVNLYVNAAVNAVSFTSNVATGTAPLTVTSTTRVANLNVAYSNVADFINLTTATTGIYYPIFANAITGNITEVGNANFSANMANGYFTATGFSGTHYGAATGLTGIPGANVTGTVANATYAVSAGSATTAGTVTTAAQPNITSVGTLASLSVSGNANIGNIGTAGLISATGNIRGGNIAVGTSLSAWNTSLLGVVETSTGALIAGPYYDRLMLVSGALLGSGGWSYTGSTAATYYAQNEDGSHVWSVAPLTPSPTITFIEAMKIDVTGNVGIGGIITPADMLEVYGNVRANIFYSTVTTGTAPLIVNSTTQVANLNAATAGLATYATTANSVAGANVSGTVANATYAVSAGSATTATSATTAGTVTTAAQGNITSVGTLTNANVSGTVTASRLVSNIATGTAPLTVTSTTRVANLNVAYANVADFINVTAPGTGTGYIISASATTGNVSEYTSAGITMNMANNAITATTFVGTLSGTATSAGSATTAGTVTTAAQPNITSVGTLLNLSVKSNIAHVSPNGANTITNQMLNGGTLAWTGTSGQLFSITDSMTGTVFSVNDTSGIPSIEVLDSGLIKMAEFGGFVAYGVSNALTANGSTQLTALALTRPINNVTTTAASTGVRLPAAYAGMRIVVRNGGASALAVYPAVSGIINSLSTNAAYSLGVGAMLEFIAMSTTQWYTMNATYA